MMPALHIGEYKVSAIAARHGDAEILARALSQFNIELVRGAGANGRFKDRGGVHALRMALRLLKGGSTFSMTADVPPGPARHAGDGIVTLARLSGRPIMPLAVASSRFLTFNSWSRMTVNLPWSKLVSVIGEPIFVPAETEGEHARYRQQVEDALNQVTERAYALCGGDIKRIAPPAFTRNRRAKMRA
jgi:3-deoxy-D-manno-octulosonic-acid transferase